ncbi:hypothetical protein [Zunongwangia pacifica]|uniref:Uncharacterized protein n=1 Tax=Zunongwangia pacifica TaxID=2911062 RepID=A0A9X1ZZI9_9FLAO|nr:hypothetical protein [Zunongwangia pacifica]MCL6219905.1 hypothetical protein [Zunongwangia pacifica]
MQKFGYSFPIDPEKVEDWLNFVKEIKHNRSEEFSQMHARIGVYKESWYLQQRNNTYEVVVYTEAESENFMLNFKNDHSDFSNWFRAQVAKFQTIDLDTEIEMPQLVLDWNS